jgi:lipopolysaccharide/colanic/teichoic acid biosynthesis glycosyltransferase
VKLPFDDFLKRTFDIAGSVCGLVLLLPLLIAVAVLVRMDSLGPIFYRGMRVGRYGKPFRILKFRTMVVNAEKLGGYSAADDDPRITRIGRFLRKYKIDEIPQLVNVLKGEMSIVGPRPEVQHYVDMFTEGEKIILSIRPGITDWASLWNPDQGAILVGSPDTARTYMEKIRPEKMRLQLRYVSEETFLVDIKIILMTIWAIITRKKLSIDGGGEGQK